ncbi:MAG: hypothetical protein C4318_09100 [Acidimicrobiia bacterium]
MRRYDRATVLVTAIGLVVIAIASGAFYSRSHEIEGTGGDLPPRGRAASSFPKSEDGHRNLESATRNSFENLLSAGREYRSPGPHKVVIYGNQEPFGVPGFRPVMFGPGYTVGVVEKEPPEEVGSVEIRDDMNIVRLRNGAFDTTVAEPQVPSEWRRDLPQGTERFLVIVQAPGPINDSWLKQIQSSGVEPVAYLPENAYIALASKPSLETIQKPNTPTDVQFVGAYHPYYAIDKSLMEADGVADVVFMVPNSPEGTDALRRVAMAAAKEPEIVRTATVQVGLVRIDAAVARDIAAQAAVLSAQLLPELRLLDEKPAQWMAGSRTADRSNASAPGYLTWYSSRGFGGPPDFAVAVADSGLTQSGTINQYTVHPDLLGPSGQNRIVAANNYTSDPTLADFVGHGTAVAGIIAGRNTGTGSSYEDIDGYNYGLGVDPEAKLVISKAFGATGNINASYIVSGPKDEFLAGARITNGSWGSTNPRPEYDSLSFLFDAYTVDVLAAPGRQQMTFVFAAGNNGPNLGSISSPANAKNVIAVGSNENARPSWLDNCDTLIGQSTLPNTQADNMEDVARFSARGPTLDGRIKPDVVAPGIHVTSHRVLSGEPCPGSPLPGGFAGYTSATGTSFSAPHVSGEASLIRRWFAKKGWKTPSPAMVKAYVIQGAVYLTGAFGGGNLPTNSQGFGATAFDELFTDTTIPLNDQSYVFTQTGQTYESTAAVADPSKPLTVTLAYSDAPGNTVGASYVNDLDLEVEVGGKLYRGNVTAGQYSVEGGTPDPKNNVERVLLPAGQSGPVTIRVKAKNIAGDAVPDNVDPTDQDFALVASNLSATQLLTLERVEFSDAGDHNGRLGNPEPFEVTAYVRNLGTSVAPAVGGTLSTPTPRTDIAVATSTFGDIAPGFIAANSTAFRGMYEGNCTSDVEFTLTVSSGSLTSQFRFTIPSDPRPESVYQNFGIPISDAHYVEGGLGVSGGGAVLDVNVFVQVEHARMGDLLITLRSPAGLEIVLSNKRGGWNRGLLAEFDDSANSPISAADQPVGFVLGRFRPDQPLSGFFGQSAQGTWVVRVYDVNAGGGGIEGTLLSAGIRVITGCAQPACTSRPLSPASTAYLAEGATAGEFDTWVLLANPGPSKVLACLTFLTEGGSRSGPLVSLEPLSRKSILVDAWVTSYNVATVVEGIGGSVLAERAMYSAKPGLQGAHSVKAISSPSRTWFLPEGATAGPFETWVLVANPSVTETATVSVTYMTGTGPVPGPSFSLPPQVRRSIRVDDTVDTYDVSTLVSSVGAAVVTERSSYVAPGVKRGATASPGVAAPLAKWYLAEGATTGGFETWILVANPSFTDSVSATINFLTESGPAAAVPIHIPPRSRRSVRANDYSASYHVSTIVEFGGSGAVAERAMYFDHPTFGKGAASGEGVPMPGSQWVAVEGATAGGFETWILVANPDNSAPATVRVEFLSTGGLASVTTLSVPPLSRRSIRANDYISSFDVTTKVTVEGTGQVIVERSTYTPSGPSSDATASPAFRIA